MSWTLRGRELIVIDGTADSSTAEYSNCGNKYCPQDNNNAKAKLSSTGSIACGGTA